MWGSDAAGPVDRFYGETLAAAQDGSREWAEAASTAELREDWECGDEPPATSPRANNQT